jgi:hypothetical protein
VLMDSGAEGLAGEKGGCLGWRYCSSFWDQERAIARRRQGFVTPSFMSCAAMACLELAQVRPSIPHCRSDGTANGWLVGWLAGHVARVSPSLIRSGHVAGPGGSIGAASFWPVGEGSGRVARIVARWRCAVVGKASKVREREDEIAGRRSQVAGRG